MNSMPRSFTPSRIAALFVISVLISGLGYLRFAPDEAVKVPAGAKPGDLTLRGCTYKTEDGGRPAECGTLVVPENRADKGSRLIALPITLIKARTGRPAEPIFRLEGGPGKTNMKFPMASRFTERHDVVLLGYRGVDGSSVLECPEVTSVLQHSDDFLAQKSLDDYSAAFRKCAVRLEDDGVDLDGYSLAQRVDDFEAARRALGYKRVNLVSESAGTRTALIYAWRFPQSIHRSVMIAVNPPGGFLWNPARTDEQIRRYAQLCTQVAACKTRTDDLETTVRDGMADMPDHWGPLPIKKGHARVASFYGLMEATDEAAPLSGSMTLDTLMAAADGDASGHWFQSLMAELAFPEAFEAWGEMAAAGRIDADLAERYFAQRPASVLGDPGTTFIWAGGGLARAWPAQPDEDRYDRMRTSNVETLLVGGRYDFATPPQNATDQVLPYLPRGRQVVLGQIGHTVDFWNHQPDAGARLINAYLDSGRVDRSLYRERRDHLEPEVTQTALAKGIAGTMAGFALITLLSFAWLPLRTCGRRRFGRKSSAFVRSVHAVIMGLGGWFLAVLAIMISGVDVSLASEALGVLAMGIPAGVCVYWGSRGGDGSRRGARIAALTGALAGAWFGFGALAGLGAVLSTPVGAAAGANLAVILLDVARSRAATRRGPALSGRVST